MIIKELEIRNFRRFQSLSVTLEDDLTVIVARNGQGKTTLLDAMTIALGTFVGAFEMGKARHIEKSDARLMRFGSAPEGESQYPVEVRALFKSPNLSVFRELTGPKNKTTIRDAHPITEYGSELQAMISRGGQDPLPLISYYGAGRLWRVHKNVERKKVLSASRSVGYEDCLSPSSNFVQCQQWMLKATMSSIQEQTLSPEQRPEISSKEKLLAIQEAVDSVLREEGWSGFHYSFAYEELTMFHPDHGNLPVSLLSDGVRGMVSMTADIAFRCVRLNGYLGREAARRTQGIVLIDEVDIHLHPAWQQRVIHSLRDAFPNIQFIVTTHSPQVLSTIHRDNIRVIGPDPAGKMIAEKPLSSTYGEPSGDVMRSVMLVDPQPPVPEAADLLKLTELVDQGLYDHPDASRLMTELVEVLGPQHPQLQRLQRSIQRQRMLAR